ncbi:RNA polymerase sigma-70 factor, ECF subfamily [Lampropedia hyalina DSM 16112]|jgi:RNA polymerase sigma-70 factor (ECF subfamily)|uniref:RNA polymerase sigma-70 factor, ECF subfamily n=1 Tax=Lampropedia hyalina DSM 16112 TaxID=1122156 RepID=A0A1M4SET6_9BURK|nr:sigma-70 family RNA polymerase sigma factor [Lampropedia hyalina]SHE30672.1 RNA polymerase sigma-70 factor, ECF subfamily [Lampropedia hyalina DSM 16112]
MTTAAHAPIASLYRDHHRWLHAWLLRRLDNECDAADLAHDTFLRLLKVHTMPVFHSTGEARAYLRTTASRLCINLWQRQEVERSWQETLAALPPDHYPSAERQAIILQALEEVAAMLRSLPPRVAKAFLLAEVSQMTDAEVAARLKISERTVRNYVAQAMLACLKLQARDTVQQLSRMPT